MLTLAVGTLALAGCGSSSKSPSSKRTASSPSTSSQSTSTPTTTKPQIGFENVPIELGASIAPASTTQTGPVDGIQCGATEQLAYHIHAHLAVYVNGQPRALPGGIGIPGSQVVPSSRGPIANGGQCIYFLHTHAPDGVIHIESPSKRIYTLGNFFDEWHQPLTTTQIGGVKGSGVWIVNGKTWTADPRNIPLTPHTVIQFNVGEPPVPFRTVDWSQTGL